MSNRYAREIPAGTTNAAFRFFVHDPDFTLPGSPEALAGITGLVEADFNVYAADPGSSLPALVSPISAANYTITERGFGDYDLVFSVDDYFTTEGLSSIVITRSITEDDHVVARLYYAVVSADPLPVDVTHWDGTAVDTPYDGGIPNVNVVTWLGDAPNALSVGRVPANVTRWASADLVTPNTAGVPRVDVKAVESNALTADALAADAVTEIQSGLATAANLALLQVDVDDIVTTLSTLAEDIWDVAVEGAHTARKYMRGFASILFNKTGGMNTSTRNFRDRADSKNRIVATVDSTGRTAITTFDLD